MDVLNNIVDEAYEAACHAYFTNYDLEVKEELKGGNPFLFIKCDHLASQLPSRWMLNWLMYQKHQKQRATAFHSGIKQGKHKYHPRNLLTDLPVVWFFPSQISTNIFTCGYFGLKKIKLPSRLEHQFRVEITFFYFVFINHLKWLPILCVFKILMFKHCPPSRPPPPKKKIKN